MIFIDKNSAIDKESLRDFALKRLYSSRGQIQKSISKPVWDQLHNAIGSEKNIGKLEKYRRAEGQVMGLPGFVDTYIKTALDSKERFELFVQLKAAELKNEDQQHNYFWGLQIRHDQIVALVTIVEKITKQLISWSEMEVGNILSDKDFIKLADTSIEDQVYLEAERVYKDRSKVMDK